MTYKKMVFTRDRRQKMKPILFNTEMVRAMLDGRKTVTRRVIKFDTAYPNAVRPVENPVGLMTASKIIRPPYQVGDTLYVRETWKRFSGMLYGWENGTYIPLDDFEGYQYKAGEQCICTKGYNPLCGGFEDQKSDIHFDDNWHPSIHMPKEAARIFLRVISVRVERLQDSFFKSGSTIFTLLREGIDIGEQCRDCIDTYGSPCCIDDESECGTLDEVRSDYSDLWNSTVKKSDLDKYGWDANPWVTVNKFERIKNVHSLP